MPQWHVLSPITSRADFSAAFHSQTGLIVGLLTMLSGPALEMALIKFTDLYHYSMPDSVGLLLVPSFIFPVYLAGAPAVGNLARLTYQWLLERAEEEGEGPEV